jgi:hypothetical protein
MIAIHMALALGQAVAGAQGAPPQVPSPVPASAFVLLIAGAPGSAELGKQHEELLDGLAASLGDRAGVAEDRIVVLKGRAEEPASAATRDRVRSTLGALSRRMSASDTLLVVLVGHSSYDGVDAKFNLVGPDFEADEWRQLLVAVPGRLVFVHTTGASFPFLQPLSGPNRIVISATATPAQKYDTVFPQFFAAAWTDEASDLDKNGRVSIWEAFSYTSAAVKRWYEQKGQLSVERAVLDDTGDGVGRDLASQGDDGMLASRTFLDADPAAAGADPAVTLLISRRDLLEGELDELKRKRSFMPAGDYERELERVIIEIARVSREIRQRIKS